ncbi:hypothetical protein V5O48_008846 [Marasmius crinis-equi]|uniref:Transmembrane protein n=1 Tax=Marasmius crinis-equi TaxID=585013 RepID=A0ABR3FCS1_9AGAR
MANPYNLSIPDNSPTFIYRPFREGEDIKAGWKSFYSNSPDSAYDSTHQNENKASGTSSHSTSMQGASFEITFKGTAIYVYGSGSGGAYTTTLDKRDAVNGNPGDGLLASYRELDYGPHTLSLNLTQGQSLNVTSATVAVGIGKKGSAVRVYGSVNYDHGAYSASLNPSGGVSTTTRTFNATSKWFAYDSMIYWESDLDRSQSYTLTLTNLDEGKYLDVHSATLMDAQGGSDGDSNHSLGTGAIVGVAAGLAAVIAIVGVLLFLFWRRRRHSRKFDGPTPATYSGVDMTKFSSRASSLPLVHLFIDHKLDSQPLLDTYVEPFILPPQVTPYTDDESSRRGSSKFNSYGPSTHTAQSSYSSSSRHLLSEGSSSSQGFNDSQRPPGAAASAKGGPPPSAPTRTVRQETDAGPVPVHPSHPEEEVLPPGYNPAWSSGQS